MSPRLRARSAPRAWRPCDAHSLSARSWLLLAATRDLTVMATCKLLNRPPPDQHRAWRRVNVYGHGPQESLSPTPPESRPVTRVTISTDARDFPQVRQM